MSLNRLKIKNEEINFPVIPGFRGYLLLTADTGQETNPSFYGFIASIRAVS